MSWRDDADYILNAVDFTEPVEPADTVAVRDSLRSALPADARIEVYWRPREGVIINIDVGKEGYNRTKKVLS